MREYGKFYVSWTQHIQVACMTCSDICKQATLGWVPFKLCNLIHVKWCEPCKLHKCRIRFLGLMMCGGLRALLVLGTHVTWLCMARPGINVYSLQAGQNFPPAEQISLQCGVVSLMYFFIVCLQITKFPGKEFPVLPVFSKPGVWH